MPWGIILPVIGAILFLYQCSNWADQKSTNSMLWTSIFFIFILILGIIVWLSPVKNIIKKNILKLKMLGRR